jgi:hypothetical protein
LKDGRGDVTTFLDRERRWLMVSVLVLGSAACGDHAGPGGNVNDANNDNLNQGPLTEFPHRPLVSHEVTCAAA